MRVYKSSTPGVCAALFLLGRSLLFALPIGLATGVLAQGLASRRPVFDARIDLVNLNVTVTDGRSRYVSGLAEKDFEVFEDGVPQKLALFAQEDLPISLAILIDTSASMNESLKEAQSAAVRFVGTLGPQDDAQVIQFNERAQVLQDFTSDKTRLAAAIESTRAAGGTALYTALYVALKDLDSQRRKGELRRRCIVVLSDGEDTSSLVTDDQVMELARETGIGIYGVSLASGSPARASGSLTRGQTAFFFSALSRETGGQAHFPRSLSDLKGIYERVARELHAQYSMGYVSSNLARDGKWRRVVIRTPGRESLQLRHKSGYYAPRN